PRFDLMHAPLVEEELQLEGWPRTLVGGTQRRRFDPLTLNLHQVAPPVHFSSARSNLPAFLISSWSSRNRRRFVKCSRSDSRLRFRCCTAPFGSSRRTSARIFTSSSSCFPIFFIT